MNWVPSQVMIHQSGQQAQSFFCLHLNRPSGVEALSILCTLVVQITVRWCLNQLHRVCHYHTLLRVHLFSRRCKSYRPVTIKIWHVMRELNNVHCTLARNEGKKEIPICDWVPARINNVMWWHPSLHERLSTRAKVSVVIATTGA